MVPKRGALLSPNLVEPRSRMAAMTARHKFWSTISAEDRPDEIREELNNTIALNSNLKSALRN
jgi:hypothetical protein